LPRPPHPNGTGTLLCRITYKVQLSAKQTALVKQTAVYGPLPERGHGSKRPASRAHGPKHFHHAAAHANIPIVQIARRVAMRGNERHPIVDRKPVAGIGKNDMLI